MTRQEYFDLNARFGITKHVGGLAATKEIIQSCNITKDSLVLEVGCGAGFVTSYLAKKIGCSIVSIDIDPQMITLAKKRAEKKKVDDKIEFYLAAAEKLPFDDNTFDVVISESVTAFTNKDKSIKEYARVVKKGGFVALNELTLLKPMSKDLGNFLSKEIGEIKPLSSAKWEEKIENNGLQLIRSHCEKIRPFKQGIEEAKLFGMESIHIYFRAMGIFLKDKEIRDYFKRVIKYRKKFSKAFNETLGGGIYVGKK